MALRGVLAIILVAFGIWLFIAKASHRMPDFEVYWRAGVRAAAAEPLYRPADEDYQLKYFPSFAIAAIPLGMMPLDTAKVAWFAVSGAALVVLLPLSVSLLPHRRQPVWLLLAALLVCLGKYYAEDLVLGQINTRVALVASLAILALKRGRESIAGVLIAFAIVLIVASEDAPEELRDALLAATGEFGLTVSVSRADGTRGEVEPTHLLSVYGADRPGILAGVSRALAEVGASVVASSRDLARAEQAAASLPSPGGARHHDARPVGALLLPGPGHRHGVLGVDRLPAVVPLVQAHAATGLQVYGGDDCHNAVQCRPIATMARPPRSRGAGLCIKNTLCLSVSVA